MSSLLSRGDLLASPVVVGALAVVFPVVFVLVYRCVLALRRRMGAAARAAPASRRDDVSSVAVTAEPSAPLVGDAAATAASVDGARRGSAASFAAVVGQVVELARDAAAEADASERAVEALLERVESEVEERVEERRKQQRETVKHGVELWRTRHDLEKKLDEQREAFTAQVARVRSEASRRVHALQATVVSLKDQLGERAASAGRLTSELDASHARVQQLEEELEASRAELRKQNAATLREVQRAQVLGEANAALQKRNEQLQQCVVALETRCMGYEDTVCSLEADVALRVSEAECAASVHASSQIDRLKAECDAANASVAQLSDQFFSSVARVRVLETELASASELLQASRSARVAAQDELRRVEAESAQLRSLLVIKDNDVEVALLQQAAKESEACELERRVGEREQSERALRERCDAAVGRLQVLQEENAELLRRIVRLETDMDLQGRELGDAQRALHEARLVISAQVSNLSRRQSQSGASFGGARRERTASSSGSLTPLHSASRASLSSRHS